MKSQTGMQSASSHSGTLKRTPGSFPSALSSGRGNLQRPHLAIVGEAWGEQEERALQSWFGPAGQELSRQLLDAGIDRNACLLTNVIQRRPPNNELRNFCLTRNAAVAQYTRVRPELVARYPEEVWPETYSWPALVGPGGFLHPEYLGELARLRSELLAFKPVLIIALGNTACWGLLRTSGIGKLRGYLYPCTLLPGYQVLPTYHPSSILRQFSNRPVVLADLAKALRLASPSVEQQASLARDSERTIWVEPTFADMEAWWTRYVGSNTAARLAIDIETFGGTITCLGFGTKESAISIPFWDRRQPTGNYWSRAEEELAVLEKIRTWLLSANPKILQNAMYDLQYLWRTWGMTVNNVAADTMLIHHALQPEMSKDLNFMGATYTDVPAWKQMRKLSEAAAKRGKKDA